MHGLEGFESALLRKGRQKSWHTTHTTWVYPRTHADVEKMKDPARWTHIHTEWLATAVASMGGHVASMKDWHRKPRRSLIAS